MSENKTPNLSSVAFSSIKSPGRQQDSSGNQHLPRRRPHPAQHQQLQHQNQDAQQLHQQHQPLWITNAEQNPRQENGNTENFVSALGINFDRPSFKKAADSPQINPYMEYTRSPSMDYNDSGFQPISRTNTFEMYKNSNNSDGSLVESLRNGNGRNNLNSTISNLTFSPLSTTRTNVSENSTTSPKIPNPFHKAKMLAQKANKTNRDFLQKRKYSNADDSENIFKGKSSVKGGSIISNNIISQATGNALSGSKTKGDSKKKIFSDLSSLSKPRIAAAASDVVSMKRSSSESKRIPPTINELSDASTISSKKSHSHHHHHHHHHHHLLLRSSKASVPNVLSSSSSNSKVISDSPALYNFHPTANNSASNEVLRIISAIESEILTKPINEDRKNDFIDRLLHLLYSSVLPLFKGETLATPVEDLNKLMEVYLLLRINNNDVKQEISNMSSDSTDVSTSSDAKIIIKEFQDFIKVGLSLMENQSNIDNATQKQSRLNKFNYKFGHNSQSSFSESSSSLSFTDGSSQFSDNGGGNLEVENKIAALWDFFLHDILSYLEAIFLPLQLEFEGCGNVLTNSNISHNFWSQLLVPDDELNVKRFLLNLFRDSVIIPNVEKLGNVNNFFVDNNDFSTFANSADDSLRKHDESYPQKLCLLQCFGILSTTQSKDYSQRVVESLLDIMKKQIKI